MARPWRIEYEGALYHVFSRGNNRQDIFVTDDDRYVFLDTLFIMARRQIYKFADWRLIGFNPLIGKPEGSNHAKKNCQRAKDEKAD